MAVSGSLTARGENAGEIGGSIRVSGEQVGLLSGAQLDASGMAGGGEILVGGDYRGNNPDILNARTSFVASDATMRVDALANGDGGKAVVWADDTTRYFGHISAQGGVLSGNGGFVEVSGLRQLDFNGSVNVSAINGMGGNVLLDPENITLSTAAGPLTNQPNGTPDIAFLDPPAVGTTNVQISGITGFSELFLQATNNITVANAITMATNNSIRLEANNNIFVNAAIITTGTGSIRLTADADNNGTGNLAIGGNLTSQAGGIQLSAATITRTIGNIATTGAANSDAGNISITSTGATNLGAATITANGGTASAGNTGRDGGIITINSTGGFTGSGAIAASGSAGNGAGTNGGHAGSVSITSANSITTGAINSTGGNAGTTNGNAGNAGTINLTNSTAGVVSVGALTARTGVATGTGAGGTAGSVSVSNTAAGQSVTTGAINTAGNTRGHGGAITLASAGALTVNGTISSSGAVLGAGTTNSGRNAGNITINAGGVTNITGAITASGAAGLGTNQAGGQAGTVNITSSGSLSTLGVTASTGAATGTGAGGTAGSVSLTGTSVGAGALTTTGGSNGQGGNISITSTTGASNVGAIATNGGAAITGNAGSNAGVLNVSSATDIVTGVITAIGTAGVGTNQNGASGGAVNLTAGSSITLSNITTSGGARTGSAVGGNGGNININGNALLATNTTVAANPGTGGLSGGAIIFGGTVDSSGVNRTLTINTTGATILNRAIGNTLALASITTNAGGTTAINGGLVNTTGAQIYNDAVTLGNTTNLTTSNSAITFANSVNASGNALTMSTGGGDITAANASNNFANVAIASANNVNLRDVNAIVLGSSNVTGNYTLQTAGAVTQAGALTVGGTTSINAGATNDVTLDNANNNFNSIAITTGRDVNIVDVNTLTVNASSLRSLNARALSGNLTLNGNVTASGTGSGTSINLVTSGNFLNPGNHSLTAGAGSRWLVYSTTPTSDIRGVALYAASNFKQYNAILGDTILGAGNGFVYSVAPLITPILTGSASKTYDGNNVAPIGLLNMSQSGALDDDTIVLSAISSANFDNRNAGVGKLVSMDNVSLMSASNAGRSVFGYQLASTTASGNVGTINQAVLNLNAVSDAKVYDATTHSNGMVSISGLVSGDTISHLTQSFASRNVQGANGSTLNVNNGFMIDDGNGGNNYQVLTHTATGTITPLTITGAITAHNKTYDGTVDASIHTRILTGVLGTDNVSLVGGVASFDNRNAGENKLVTATGLGLYGTDAGNYLVNTTATTTADIFRASISAVSGIIADNKIYDATTIASLNTAGANFIGVIAGDSLGLATANGQFVDANVANAITVNIIGISLTGADANNYQLLDTNAIAFADITPRPLTIIANPGQSKPVGAPDPVLTFAVSGMGLLGSDSLLGALSRNSGETVGSYAILLGSLNAGSNYIIDFIGNEFSIFAPTGQSPRDEAGLGSLINRLDGQQQYLAVLNVASPAAGEGVESDVVCDAVESKRLNNPNTSVIFNFGLRLPAGISVQCL